MWERDSAQPLSRCFAGCGRFRGMCPLKGRGFPGRATPGPVQAPSPALSWEGHSAHPPLSPLPSGMQQGRSSPAPLQGLLVPKAAVRTTLSSLPSAQCPVQGRAGRRAPASLLPAQPNPVYHARPEPLLSQSVLGGEVTPPFLQGRGLSLEVPTPGACLGWPGRGRPRNQSHYP